MNVNVSANLSAGVGVLLLATALAAPAAALPAFPTPYPDDPRCGAFGYSWSEPMPRIPVARPVIQDLTPTGDLAGPTAVVAHTLSDALDLSGVFWILPADAGPADTFVVWNSPNSFDYIGWRDAGAWLVLVGEVSPAAGGVRVRLDAYLTEEGDRLSLGGAEAVVEPARLPTFANRYVNALLQCITGLPGAFGTRIAYARRPQAGAPKEIWTVEFGSQAQVQVSHDGQVAMLPAWAPGGGVAWTGYARGNPEVFAWPCEACGARLGEAGVFSARRGQNSGVAFSPDGRLAALTLAPDGNPDVWLVDGRTGADVARLTTGPGIDTSPSWSPDGRRIAFVSDRDGGPQVWVMDADGKNQRSLPLPGGYNTSPDWSPSGNEVAYQSRGEGGRFSIWAYDFATGGVRRLTSGNWDDEEPSWSPDGRTIAFTSTRRGAKLLFVMSRDGSGARPVFDGGGDYFTPAWERQFRAR